LRRLSQWRSGYRDRLLSKLDCCFFALLSSIFHFSSLSTKHYYYFLEAVDGGWEEAEEAKTKRPQTTDCRLTWLYYSMLPLHLCSMPCHFTESTIWSSIAQFPSS
jgi:hypothetical protein